MVLAPVSKRQKGGDWMDYAASVWTALGEYTYLPLTDLLLLILLVFGLTSFVFARTPTSQPIDASFKKYETLAVAWPSILVLWSALALVLRSGTPFIPVDSLQQLNANAAADSDKTLFLVYLIGFISLWMVYFASRSDYVATKTLRTLLSNISLNWRDIEKQNLETYEERRIYDEFENIQKAKASSSVQALSIMAASAAVVISLSSELRADFSKNGEMDVWKQFTLTTSLICGLTAFYCFVVAVDVLDTVTNRFVDDAKTKVLKHLFDRSRNPKYYGLVLLMFSLAFYVAATLPAVGALALSVAMFTGYSHWFPRLSDRTKLEWALRTFFVAVPVLFILD